MSSKSVYPHSLRKVLQMMGQVRTVSYVRLSNRYHLHKKINTLANRSSGRNLAVSIKCIHQLTKHLPSIGDSVKKSPPSSLPSMWLPKSFGIQTMAKSAVAIHVMRCPHWWSLASVVIFLIYSVVLSIAVLGY